MYNSSELMDLIVFKQKLTVPVEIISGWFTDSRDIPPALDPPKGVEVHSLHIFFPVPN